MVVHVQPLVERPSSRGLCAIRPGIGPLVEQGSVVALDFPVGPGAEGLRAGMGDLRRLRVRQSRAERGNTRRCRSSPARRGSHRTRRRPGPGARIQRRSRPARWPGPLSTPGGCGRRPPNGYRRSAGAAVHPCRLGADLACPSGSCASRHLLGPWPASSRRRGRARPAWWFRCGARRVHGGARGQRASRPHGGSRWRAARSGQARSLGETGCAHLVTTTELDTRRSTLAGVLVGHRRGRLEQSSSARPPPAW